MENELLMSPSATRFNYRTLQAGLRACGITLFKVTVSHLPISSIDTVVYVKQLLMDCTLTVAGAAMALRH